MKQIALLALISGFCFSCTLVTRRGENPPTEPEVNEPAPPVAEAGPAPKASYALKRSIVDKNLKQNAEDKELKKRVAVLPFLDRKGLRSAKVLTDARNAFMDSLNQTGELIAVDSGALKLDLNKYIKNNMYDLEGLAKDANTVGISSVLEGRIVDMRFKNEDAGKIDNSSSLKTKPLIFEVVVQARMLNLRSGQELFNTVKTVELDDSSSVVAENITSENFFNKNSDLTELLIKDAFLDFNDKLVDALKLIQWEGRIAALHGDKIYLNVGQISGVQVGDILKVVEDGNEIYDTELGYHVGKVQGKVKGTLEIVGFFGQDGAVSVVHSGAGFKENDRVETYR